MATIKLYNSSKINIFVSKQQQQEIKAMYEAIAKDVQNKIDNIYFFGNDSVSEQLQMIQLKDLQNSINKQLTDVGKQLEKKIPANMEKVVNAVGADNAAFAQSIGMEINGAFAGTPSEVINAIFSGKVYGGGWQFSNSVWKNIGKNQSDIEKIIAQGVAQNKGSYEIAKDLERYVDPNARKDWDWSKVYPGTSKKVDYNAQRLARTLVAHAHQRALVRDVQHNPFVEGIQWLSAFSHRSCEMCMERDGVIYPKDEVPMDHPMGLCNWIAVIPATMDEIADRLNDWVHGKEDKALDRYAQDLNSDYGKKPKADLVNKETVKPSNNKFNNDAYNEMRKNEAFWGDSGYDADISYRDEAGDLWRNATAAQKEAMHEYTHMEYSRINHLLRESAGKNINDYAQHMTDYINKSTYEFDAWLQRGVDSYGAKSWFKKDLFDLDDIQLQGLVGNSYVDDGFVSAGSVKGAGFSSEDVIMNIYAPEGTKMAYAEPFSYFQGGNLNGSAGVTWDGVSAQTSLGDELEMIIQRGTKFKISKIERAHGKVFIDLDIIDQI